MLRAIKAERILNGKTLITGKYISEVRKKLYVSCVSFVHNSYSFSFQDSCILKKIEFTREHKLKELIFTFQLIQGNK